MARLVAATCPKCGASVKLDPQVEWVTCTYCGTSSFIQTKARQPTQQVIQAHYPIIQVKPASAAWIAIPIALAVIGTGISAAVAIIPGIIAARAVTSNVSVTLPRPAAVEVATRAIAATPPVTKAPKAEKKDDFFRDATSLRTKLEESIGKPLKAKQLVLYGSYAMITLQDPKNPAHIDRYTFRDGSVGEPQPERMGASDRPSVEKALFDLAEVDFTRVPVMSEDALKAIPVEEGKVTHLILTRGLPFHKDVVWRVYVNGPRDSGYVEYLTSGKRKRVVN